MFEQVIGDWPKHQRFILTSCDTKYFDQYFPRFYKTYSEHWSLPIHVHIIDPTQNARYRLDRLPVTYTHCVTDKAILKFPYSYETYCQAQRFILLGHKMLENQSVIVADVDSYALNRTTTGPGIDGYVPTANLNASKKKKTKKLKEAPLQMKHGDAIDVVLDKVKNVIKKDLERGKVDSLNQLGKMVKVKASGVENKPGRHIVTLNQEFTMDEREDTTTKE